MNKEKQITFYDWLEAEIQIKGTIEGLGAGAKLKASAEKKLEEARKYWRTMLNCLSCHNLSARLDPEEPEIWECKDCGASGEAVELGLLRCPACGKTSAEITGGYWRCVLCGADGKPEDLCLPAR